MEDLGDHLIDFELDVAAFENVEDTQEQETAQPTETSKQPHQVQYHQPQTHPIPTGAQAGKILLVPINSKFRLPPGATVGALTTAGNKKQIIQLFPVTSSHLLPSTTTNNSPAKHQQQSLTLNKSLSNLQNNLKKASCDESLRVSTPNTTNEVPKRKPCNCTKSQCLKLYCDCFANGEFCSGCNCTNCFNSLSKEKERQKAISQCLERNPEAFRPKIGKAVKLSVGEPAPDSIERRHTKGCNCKRSGCLKNYCECYEAKILCSNLCKCCGCKNYEESFERKSLMQLANSASENARGILKNLLPTNNTSSTGNEFTKCFITDKVIQASLMCLLQSAQQAEKDGTLANTIPNLIQTEMGKCLRMIVDSATETSSPKKR